MKKQLPGDAVLNFLRVLTFVSFVALFGSARFRSAVLICCIEDCQGKLSAYQMQAVRNHRIN